MRVLLLLPNLAMGGAERAMVRTAEALGDAGDEVLVLLVEDRIEIPVPATVRIEILQPGKIRSGWWANRSYAVALRWRVAALHARWPIDVAVSTLPFMDEIATRASVPNLWLRVANTLSAEIARLSGWKAGRRARRYRRLYGRRRTIVVSEGVGADLVSHFGARPDRVRRLYGPFDFEALRRQANEPEPDLPAERFVLHAARFAPQKRFDVLLDAYLASGIPHRLVLLTDPDPNLLAMIAARGLGERVTVTGFRRNPYPWIARAAAVILSSDREGMPNVLVEALGLGTPVVSTDCPSGPREVLTGPLARFLSPVGDAEALGRNLRAVVENPPIVGPDIVGAFGTGAFVRDFHALATEKDRR